MKDFWSIAVPELLDQLKTSRKGLTEDEAAIRLKSSITIHQSSRVAGDIRLFLKQFASPLTAIMLVALILSSALAEFSNTIIIGSIILLTGVLGFLQERKAGNAVAKLLDLVKVKTTVVRDSKEIQIPRELVVSGDIVILNAGDMIPGDCRLIEAKDLHVNEAILTGESFPQEKQTTDLSADTPIGRRVNSVFQGTNVISGTASAVVVANGTNTALGKIATDLTNSSEENSFERGIKRFGYLLMRVTLIMATVIVMFNIYLERPVVESFLFGLSLALGMTPELLPAIVTITLSAGAKRMADKKVIIKKLQAIQNLGSINVLCADKTGTLTEGNVTVQSTVDINGDPSDKVRTYAYLNAVLESGFTNPLDEALRKLQVDTEGYSKFDEVPYDFIRKRLSIVVTAGEKHLMITKGAVLNTLSVSDRVDIKGETYPIDQYKEKVNQLYETFSLQGSRTIGIAYKDVTGDPTINKDDEGNMIFLGLIALADPPKPNIQQSLEALYDSGVMVKLITGDNEKIARHLSQSIGLTSPTILTGEEIATLSEEALMRKVAEVNIFAEAEPNQKERIVRAIRKAGNTVGYLGDGINDVAAMKAADVSISVDTATDVAKETADIVLMEKDLDVLKEGVYEGRKTFANTMKYIFITSSANFGNMVSMALASLILPFLPLLPKQILLTNFITDLPAMTLPKDTVANDSINRPTGWRPKTIRNFMIVFGIESSIFDLITFAMLVYYFKATASETQSAWFIESILSEILILLIIRSPKPFFRSIPGKALMTISVILILFVLYIPFSPAAKPLDLIPLPSDIFVSVIVIVVLYCLVAEITKAFFFKRMRDSGP